MRSFNLIDQPWIPVCMSDRRRSVLSIRDLLLQSKRVATIEDSSPLTTVALHRLVLAVLHRALQGPITSEDAADWLEHGFPAGSIAKYLDRWYTRFDLFHPERPFFQVPGLENEAKPKPVSFLSFTHGSNNTLALFNPALRRGFDPEPALPAQAARMLITYQSFVLGGLVRVFLTSAPGSAIGHAATTVVLGDDLHETLCLNLVPYHGCDYDIPFWEQEDTLQLAVMKTAPTAKPAGFVQGYTWPYRSVLLLPEGDSHQLHVSQVVVGGGLRMHESDAYRTDPMLTYQLRDSELTVLRFREDRGFWRDYSSLLPHKALGEGVEPGVVLHAIEVCEHLGREDRVPRVLVAGVSSNQAKILQWREEVFRLPSAVYSDHGAYSVVHDALNAAEDGGKFLWQASFTLAKHLLSRRRSPDAGDIRGVAQTLPGSAVFWSCLETEFQGLLARLTRDADQDTALDWWWARVYYVLRHAWQRNAAEAGTNGGALRAVALAERQLAPHLAQLRGRISQDNAWHNDRR